MNSTDAYKNVAELVNNILTLATKAVDELGKDVALPITKLSEKVSLQLDTDKLLCYSIITCFFKNRDDMMMTLGPKGGWRKK